MPIQARGPTLSRGHFVRYHLLSGNTLELRHMPTSKGVSFHLPLTKGPTATKARLPSPSMSAMWSTFAGDAAQTPLQSLGDSFHDQRRCTSIDETRSLQGRGTVLDHLGRAQWGQWPHSVDIERKGPVDAEGREETRAASQSSIAWKAQFIGRAGFPINLRRSTVTGGDRLLRGYFGCPSPPS
jgi:hypothetical protein